MRKPIRLLLVLWCAALFLASFVRAAPFDETVKAPRAASIIELPTQLRGHFDRFDSARTNARDAFIRDDAAYRKWFDLNFSLHRALDERRSLGNLSEFGFIANPDGSYTVDLQKYPQWAPLDQRLYALRAPDVIATFAARLRARGFTDSDFEAMKAYVATHDANQQLLESGKELVDSYAKRLQRGRRSGQALNLEESWAFRYQTNLVRKESERAWVIGLLDFLA